MSWILAYYVTIERVNTSDLLRIQTVHDTEEILIDDRLDPVVTRG